jgi:23S rRNA pseudouridine2605 synthase
LETRVRLAKRIAECGIASRREAERLIEAGRVAVNGQIIATPVFFVNDLSKISVDGKIIDRKSEKIIVWKFYKPRGVLTTRTDPQNRRTVFDFVNKKTMGACADQRLLYVGRLDYTSEGLLLFTNSGDIARKMELPSTGLKRVYRVRIFGHLSKEKIRALKNGITIDGIRYGSISVKIDNFDGDSNNAYSKRANFWTTITLNEGKNREIKKVMKYFGCRVSRLLRIKYGPFSLENLVPGTVQQASGREIDALLEMLIGATGS